MPFKNGYINLFYLKSLTETIVKYKNPAIQLILRNPLLIDTQNAPFFAERERSIFSYIFSYIFSIIYFHEQLELLL